jgi:glycine dehydrogenase subunit 1
MPEKIVYPYIPNSVPEVQAEMLKSIGAKDIEDFFRCIPQDLRVKGLLDLPKPFLSEASLKRHVEGILSKNRTSGEMLSFLGGGCWNHYVPAVCDEVNGRSEFLTAYAGEPYEDHGRFQALFEYESLMAELLDVDVVNVPTYDGSQAASTALRMAGRITGRDEILVADTTSRDRLSAIEGYLHPDMKVTLVAHEPATGLVDKADLDAKMTGRTAAVYFENPSYLGFIETRGREIADAAHAKGALCVVYADPSSLGVLTPPSNYGADLTCGDIQPLGIHMFMGGGRGGFIGAPDDVKFIEEYPSRLFGIAPTSHKEWGFGDVAWERTSFAKRENAKEFVGTAAALWGITAAVYLSLMGPEGMRELGEACMARTAYAIRKLGAIKGVRVPAVGGAFFKEFPVNFDGTGRTVEEINKALLGRGILGGHDLSEAFPWLGQSALYAFTEVVTQDDIDTLAEALAEVTAR